MSDYQQIGERLRDLYPDLPRVLKIVATYMLEHPGDIATLSMRRVATNAGVSLPNFSRMAKILGYETYSELRDVYRKQVQQHDIKDYHLRAVTMSDSEDSRSNIRFWEQLRDAALTNVSSLFEANDPEHIAEIARMLSKSRHVYLVGMQASQTHVSYLHYLAGMTSGKFRLLQAAGGVLADSITDISEKDTVITISLQPCANAAIQVSEFAQERKAKVIAITDSPASPIAIMADHTLLAQDQAPFFFGSFAGVTVLIEALIGFFTIEERASATDRIKQIEADRIRLGEYWKDKEV